ncbi:MAG: glycerophosphodiester phosphodiesterase family protein, partial [Pseudomonadota bacterium]
MKTVLDSYRFALQKWGPLVAAHAFIRIFVSSIMVPVIGIGLSLTLLASDQAALTDQDIARFLFTPAGAIGAVVLISLLLVAIVLDVIIATAVLRQGAQTPLTALKLAAGFAIYSAPRLLPFMARFIVKVLIIILPFLAIGGAIAFFFLTQHDINYYLSERPPEFLTAVGLIGFTALALIAVLVPKLCGWAIALHLSLFGYEAPARSFEQSQRLMQGYRLPLGVQLAMWVAIRIVAVGGVGVIAAFVITKIADWQPDSLRGVAMALLIGGLVYAVANALINAVSNGALAKLLNDEFNRSTAGQSAALDTEHLSQGSVRWITPGLVVAGVAVLSILSLGTGGVVLARINQTAEADIIAHRGAAALAPENTMASVRRALEDGTDWIEIDVQENADGDVIVAHDSDFMKAAREPTKVWDITNEALGSLDVGSWFDPSYSAERVPLLKDVLEAARGKAKVVIELKYYGHDEDLERRVIAIVEAADMADQISTMSLKYPAVQKMRELRPDWRTGVLAATFIGKIDTLEGNFLALNQAQITARVVQNAQAAGKDVYAWTVNDALSISRMLWVGVDGLITDDPAFARETVRAYNDLSLFERVMLAFGDGVDVTLDQPG